MRKSLFILMAVLAWASPSVAKQLTSIQKQGFLDKGLLDNSGFENGEARWVNSGGTFNIITSGANLGFGAASAEWTAAAGADSLTSRQKSLPVGFYGQDCRVNFFYKGGDATLTAQVIDGGSAVLASKVLSVQSDYAEESLSFACPASGSVAFRLLASAASAPVYLDQVFVGLRPGELADQSLQCKASLDPNLLLKAGYLMLQNGVELQVASDLSLDLDAVLGSDPADATSYYLYVDLDNVPAVSTLANGRQVRVVSLASHFSLQTGTPDSVQLSRYVPICYVRSADSGTVWSGTGSDFATLATRRHGTAGGGSASPLVYELSQQSVGSIGSVENAQQALSAVDVDSSTSFYSFAGDDLDKSSNAYEFTAGVGSTFNRKGFYGRENLFNFDGSSYRYITAAANFSQSGTDNISAGAWVRLDRLDSDQHLFGVYDTSGAFRAWRIKYDTSQNLFKFQVGIGASVETYDVDVGALVGEWHHYGYEYNGTTKVLRAFIDGQFYGSYTATVAMGIGNWEFSVGVKGGGGELMYGTMQDLYVDKVEKTAAEINAIYSRRFSGRQLKAGHVLDSNSFTNLDSSISFWNLDADVNDDSGNGKNLTATNTTFTGTNIYGEASKAARQSVNSSALQSTDAAFNDGGSFSIGGWFKPDGSWDYDPGHGTYLMTSGDRTGGTFSQTIAMEMAYTPNTTDQLYVSINDVGGTLNDLAVIDIADMPKKVGWNHIAGTFDSSTTELRLYLNGELVASKVTGWQRLVAPTSVLSIGGRENSGVEASSFQGDYQDVFFASKLLSQGDIKRLVSARLDHSKNLTAENQRWFGDAGIGDNKSVKQELDQGYILHKNANSLYLDHGLSAEDSIQLRMHDHNPSSTSSFAVSTFTTGKLSAAPSFPLPHGLPSLPTDVYVFTEGQSIAGEWDKRYDLCSVDETNINCDLSSLTIDGSHRVQIIAGSGPAAVAADIEADLLVQNQVSSKSISVPSGQSFYKPDVEIQAAHTYTIDGIWNTVGPIVGAGTIAGTGTLKALDAGQNGETLDNLKVKDLTVSNIYGGSPLSILDTEKITFQNEDTFDTGFLIKLDTPSPAGTGNVRLTTTNGNWMSIGIEDNDVSLLRLTTGDGGSVAPKVRTDGNCDTGNVCSGNWVGALSNNSSFNNGVFADNGQYMRVGNVVNASFRLTGDMACAGAFVCSIDVGLPIGSNFTDVDDASGNCTAAGVVGQNKSAVLHADIADNEFQFWSTDFGATGVSWWCHVTYQIK